MISQYEAAYNLQYSSHIYHTTNDNAVAIAADSLGAE